MLPRYYMNIKRKIEYMTKTPKQLDSHRASNPERVERFTENVMGEKHW
jgi:hypothetical protein